ncbi:MAG: NAD(+) diphosphatase [Candidatus Gastranaerophilaceae bacterium]
MNYCPDCGNKLVLKGAGDDGYIPYCNQCDKYYFDKFSVCVIALVVNEYDEIALLKQLYLSDKYFTFPAGYMQSGESSEDAIKREIKEEIGLNVQSLTYIQSIWFSLKSILMLGYIAKVKKSDFKLSAEVNEAIWVKADEAINKIYPEHPENIAYILCRKFLNNLYTKSDLSILK